MPERTIKITTLPHGDLSHGCTIDLDPEGKGGWGTRTSYHGAVHLYNALYRGNAKFEEDLDPNDPASYYAERIISVEPDFDSVEVSEFENGWTASRWTITSASRRTN